MEPPSPVISVVMPWVSLLVTRLSMSRFVSELAQHVDEAGRDDQALGVEGPFGDGALGSVPDEHDAVADDGNIRIHPRVPGTVDDAAVTDEDVVLGEGGESEEEKEQESFHSQRPFNAKDAKERKGNSKTFTTKDTKVHEGRTRRKAQGASVALPDKSGQGGPPAGIPLQP